MFVFDCLANTVCVCSMCLLLLFVFVFSVVCWDRDVTGMLMRIICQSPNILWTLLFSFWSPLGVMDHFCFHVSTFVGMCVFVSLILFSLWSAHASTFVRVLMEFNFNFRFIHMRFWLHGFMLHSAFDGHGASAAGGHSMDFSFFWIDVAQNLDLYQDLNLGWG